MRIKQFLKYPLPIFTLLMGLFSATLRADGLETHVVLRTSKGNMRFVLWPTVAPLTVLNFIKLSQDGFYDGTYFHRVVRGFIAQGGDPLSRSDSMNVGTGGPGYCIPAEFSDKKHKRGTLSMARRATNVDSAGSQFFICLNDAPSLDGSYAIFGELVDGWDVLDKVGNIPVTYSPQGVPERPLEKILINNVTVSVLAPPTPPDIESQERERPPSAQPSTNQESKSPVAPPPTPVPATAPTATSSDAPAPKSTDAPAPKSADAPASQPSSSPAPKSSGAPVSKPSEAPAPVSAETSGSKSPQVPASNPQDGAPSKPNQQVDSSDTAASKSSESQKPASSADSGPDTHANSPQSSSASTNSAPPAGQGIKSAEPLKRSPSGDTSEAPSSSKKDEPESKSAQLPKSDLADRKDQSTQGDDAVEESGWDAQDNASTSQMVQSKTGKNYH